MKNSHGSKGQTKYEKFNYSQEQQESFDKAFGELANKMIKQGITPKDAVGLSPNVLENLYAQAYRLYNTGKYVEATHLFRMLVMLNVMEPKYILGLAACFHMLKEYDNALQSYIVCSAIDPGNPIPHYHASDCLIQLKDYPSAMISLEMTVHLAGDKSEYAKMKERALLSLESVRLQVQAMPIPQVSEEDLAKEEEGTEKPFYIG